MAYIINQDESSKYSKTTKNALLHTTEHFKNLVIWGVYFGYHADSIYDFISDFNRPVTESELDEMFLERSLLDNGYIIAKSLIDTPQTVLIKEVNDSRFCSIPYQDLISINDSIQEELDACMCDEKFQQKVAEIFQYCTPAYNIALDFAKEINEKY